MYFFDGLEEGLRVIWEETRVRERGVTQDMILKQMGVQKAVSELRVGSSLHKCSDQCCLCSVLDRLYP